MSTPVATDHSIRAHERLTDTVEHITWPGDDTPRTYIDPFGDIVVHFTPDQAIKFARLLNA